MPPRKASQRAAAAPKKAATAVKKSPAKKPAVKKTAPAKKPAVKKTAPAKKTAVKKAVVTAAKKAPAKKKASAVLCVFACMDTYDTHAQRHAPVAYTDVSDRRWCRGEAHNRAACAPRPARASV